MIYSILFSKHRADIKKKKYHVDYGNACDELSVLTSWALRVNSACFFSLYFPAVCCPHSHSPASGTRRRYSVSVAKAARRSVLCLFSHAVPLLYKKRQKRENEMIDTQYSRVILRHVLILFQLSVFWVETILFFLFLFCFCQSKFTKVFIYSVSVF